MPLESSVLIIYYHPEGVGEEILTVGGVGMSVWGKISSTKLYSSFEISTSVTRSILCLIVSAVSIIPIVSGDFGGTNSFFNANGWLKGRLSVD